MVQIYYLSVDIKCTSVYAIFKFFEKLICNILATVTGERATYSLVPISSFQWRHLSK